MALIKCTECNKKFSEYANACPACACPTKIVENNINKKKEQLYKNAVDTISNYKKIKELKTAKEIFNSLNDFRDSSRKIKEIEDLLKFENDCQKRKIKQFAKIIVLISSCIFFHFFDIGKNNGKLFFCTKNDYDCLYGNYSSIELDNLYEKEINKLVDILKENNYISYRKGRIQVMKKEINNSTQYLNQYYRNDESDISFEYDSESLNNISLSILDKLKVEKNLLDCNDSRLEYNLLKNEIIFSCGNLYYTKNYNTDSSNSYRLQIKPYISKEHEGILTITGFFIDTLYFDETDTNLIYECIHTEIDKFLEDVLYYLNKSNININLLKFLKEKETIFEQKHTTIE